jgi:hypothetical protein
VGPYRDVCHLVHQGAQDVLEGEELFATSSPAHTDSEIVRDIYIHIQIDRTRQTHTYTHTHMQTSQNSAVE